MTRTCWRPSQPATVRIRNWSAGLLTPRGYTDCGCRKVTASLYSGLHRLFYVTLFAGNVMDMYKSIADDHAAATLLECLYEAARVIENHYAAQLRRHHHDEDSPGDGRFSLG